MIRSLMNSTINIMKRKARIDIQSNLIRPQFMTPLVIALIQQQVRTMKDKDILKLRCNACYFKKVDERWYVFCNKHPRHKQRQKVSLIQQRDRMIVTHVTRTGSYLKKHFQYPHHDI